MLCISVIHSLNGFLGCRKTSAESPAEILSRTHTSLKQVGKIFLDLHLNSYV